MKEAISVICIIISFLLLPYFVNNRQFVEITERNKLINFFF